MRQERAVWLGMQAGAARDGGGEDKGLSLLRANEGTMNASSHMHSFKSLLRKGRSKFIIIEVKFRDIRRDGRESISILFNNGIFRAAAPRIRK